METNSHTDIFFPPTSEDIVFSIEDIQKLHYFQEQLLYLSNALKDTIKKYY